MRCAVQDSEGRLNGPTVRVAVLMACHNRREQTAACLTRLRQQDLPLDIRLELFLTDDGCVDGTVDEARAIWPEATIIHGDGTLYWAASMALAERAAMCGVPDFLLWLNDDTVLHPNAVRSLLDVSSHHREAIIVGAVSGRDGDSPTYGGRVRVDAHPQRFRLLPSSDDVQRADTFNGNVVLIPRAARIRVGPLDGLFAHACADDDYGLRATGLSVPILQAPGLVGICPHNPPSPALPGGPWRRWRALQQPKALPWKSQARYLRRHAGWRWPLWLVGGQVRRVARGRV